MMLESSIFPADVGREQHEVRAIYRGKRHTLDVKIHISFNRWRDSTERTFRYPPWQNWSLSCEILHSVGGSYYKHFGHSSVSSSRAKQFKLLAPWI